jgi:hypothetical protein
MSEKIDTYAEFWPYYLREHSGANTRALHYVGTAIAILLFLRFLLTGSIGALILAVISGYFFAWLGHFWLEKNRPATFTYPLWSLYSDFRMFFLWTTGRLKPHLDRAGVQ